MPQTRKVAVLLTTDGSPNPPSLQDYMHVLDTGPNSVRRFWEENLWGFMTIEMSFFDVGLIAPDDSSKDRMLPITAARDAAAKKQFVIDTYDHHYVVFHGLNKWDIGGTGLGPGPPVFVTTDLDHTTLCHELGHALAFDHPYGRSTWQGGVWSEQYGSPYDVMGTIDSPYWHVPAGDIFPASGADGTKAGPLAARATIHKYLPAALEETGKVVYLSEGDPHKLQSATLWAAGRGGPNEPELLVFYMEGNRANERRRLYVEYRQPETGNTGPARWDAGLVDDPRKGEATGLVVHTVQPATWPDGREAEWDNVRYRGTVSLAGSDLDVLVVAPDEGPTYTVEIVPVAGASASQPDRVEVKVGRKVSEPRTWLEPSPVDAEVKESVTVEELYHPSLPQIFGKFAHRSWLTTRTWTIAARSIGQGSISDLEGAEEMSFDWKVAETMVPSNGEAVDVPLPDGRRVRAMLTSSAAAPAALELWNPDPTEEPITGVVVHATAYKTGKTPPLDFPGRQDEWSDDYHRLRRWWDLKFEHRYPKPGPRTPQQLRDYLGRLRWAYSQITRSNPSLADKLSPYMDEEVRIARYQQLLIDKSRFRDPSG